MGNDSFELKEAAGKATMFIQLVIITQRELFSRSKSDILNSRTRTKNSREIVVRDIRAPHVIRVSVRFNFCTHAKKKGNSTRFGRFCGFRLTNGFIMFFAVMACVHFWLLLNHFSRKEKVYVIRDYTVREIAQYILRRRVRVTNVSPVAFNYERSRIGARVFSAV